MRSLAPLCLIVVLATALSGCGKKPGFVEAPQYDANGNRMNYEQLNGPDGQPDTPGHRDGEKPVKRHDDFPRVYPKPWL